MMELTTFNSTVLTMSSREIAELTGKEHRNVLRVIRDLNSLNVLSAQIEPLKKVSAERLHDAGALTAALQQSELGAQRWN